MTGVPPCKTEAKLFFSFYPPRVPQKPELSRAFPEHPRCYGYYDNKSFIIFFVTNLKVDTPLKAWKEQNFAGRRYGFLRRTQYKKDTSQSGGDPINARVVHLHWQAGSFVHFSTKRIFAKSKRTQHANSRRQTSSTEHPTTLLRTQKISTMGGKGKQQKEEEITLSK